MLPNEGGSHFLSKVCNFEKTRVCKAVKIQRKHSMAYEIHKFADVMHTIMFAERLWRRKVHETAARSYFLKGAWTEQIANRTSNGATRANKSCENGSYEGRLWVRKVIF